MSEHYHGNAQVVIDGSNVPVGAIIDVDEPYSDEWHATIEVGSCGAVLTGESAHVLLLDEPLAGFGAVADIVEPSTEVYELAGHKAFIRPGASCHS